MLTPRQGEKVGTISLDLLIMYWLQPNILQPMVYLALSKYYFNLGLTDWNYRYSSHKVFGQELGLIKQN